VKRGPRRREVPWPRRAESPAAASEAAMAARGAATARGVPGGGKRGSEGGARNPGRLLLRVSFFSLFFWKRTTLAGEEPKVMAPNHHSRS